MKYLLHILGWLAILLLPYLFAIKGAVDFRHLMDNQHEINNLLNYGLLILFSYLNYLVFVPRFYLKRKYFKYFLAIGACLLIIVFLPEGFDNRQWPAPSKDGGPGFHAGRGPVKPDHPPGPDGSPPGSDPSPGPRPDPPALPDTRLSSYPPPPPFFLEKSAIMLLFFISIVVSISVQINNYLQRSEKGQLNAELSYLKMQIHPHFLFNTLNTIYALAIRKDDRTPDAIVKLSELMRYVIRDAASHKVPLEKELKYIDNYINLQESGLGTTVRIDYRTEGEAANLQIAPLILIPFIENAFKHGVNPDEETQIRILLSIREDQLQLLVFNRKVKTTHIDKGGIGMQNARERLQLLYPVRHTLTITDTDTEFIVQLLITLT